MKYEEREVDMIGPKRGGGGGMRWRFASLLAIASAVAVLLVVYACVPADTRPPPGKLTLTVSPSTSVGAAVVTADGWSVTFDRVLIAIGNSGLDDSCTVYGEAGYDRVLNLGAGSGQKLGILFGIGKCDLRFRMGPPSTDVVLGAGVTDGDKVAMQIPTPDPYVVQDMQRNAANGAGAAVDISGVATRGAVTKRVHLIYRRRVRYQRCTPDAPPADASAAELTQTAAFSDAGDSVDLKGNDDVVFNLRIEPEAILRDDLNPTAASLRFDPFAGADVDGDGLVTLDELRLVPISTIRDAGAFEAGTYELDDAGLLRRGKPIVIETLGDFVYELLVPTLVRFRDTGWCVASANQRRGPD
jgi:hypothetical protein